MKQPVNMEGGAAVTEVQVEPIAPEVTESEATVNIVTTALGTLGPQGIAPVGTKATVLLTAYSANWMKPTDAASAAKIKAAAKPKV